MDNLRETLISIIQDSVGGCSRYWAGVIADGLISNGVTFETDTNVGSKWIPVAERLPDKFGEYIVTIKTISGEVHSDNADYDPFQQRWTTGLFFGIGSKVTHWMPLPKPHVNVEGKEGLNADRNHQNQRQLGRSG